MQPDHRPTPGRIIGELLLNHPEAASLLARASHWRSLAVWSAATARRKFAATQAARLAYEELEHLLEPRRRHTVNFAVGLLLLVVLSAGLVMLDLLELGGPWSVWSALAATAVWLTAVATESWLGLVRARVTAIAPDEDHLVHATLAFAAGLIGSSRPQLPPSE